MKNSGTGGFNPTHCSLEFCVEKYLHFWFTSTVGQLLSIHPYAFKQALAQNGQMRSVCGGQKAEMHRNPV